jgi:hypothetical protein
MPKAGWSMLPPALRKRLRELREEAAKHKMFGREL